MQALRDLNCCQTDLELGTFSSYPLESHAREGVRERYKRIIYS